MGRRNKRPTKKERRKGDGGTGKEEGEMEGRGEGVEKLGKRKGMGGKRKGW